MRELLLLVVFTFELYAPYPSYERYDTPLPVLVPTVLPPGSSGKYRLRAPSGAELRRLGTITVPEKIGPTSLSVTQLEKSCKLNDGVGCAKLGYLYHTDDQQSFDDSRLC